MASKRNEILAKIKSMNPNDLESNAPAETSKMKRRKLWSIVKKVFNVLEVGSTDTSRLGGHYHHGSHHQPTPSSFREEHRFNPERAYWERAQERAYFSMIDGKGDPEPHNCDHDEH